jgi:hypothetical protein
MRENHKITVSLSATDIIAIVQTGHLRYENMRMENEVLVKLFIPREENLQSTTDYILRELQNSEIGAEVEKQHTIKNEERGKDAKIQSLTDKRNKTDKEIDALKKGEKVTL